jgi:hypothetical protein
MAAGLREATKIDTYVVESLRTSLQKQTLAIECLLEGRDVLAVLPEDIRRVCSSPTSILVFNFFLFVALLMNSYGPTTLH